MPETIHIEPPCPLWPDGAPGALGDSEGDSPVLRLCRPTESSDHPLPVIAVFPGGGYDHLADHEGEPVARWLVSLGLAAAIVRYRVRPYRLPASLLDARRAIRLLRWQSERWGLDSERVGAIGFSAGGHLAACISTIDESDPEDDLSGISGRPDVLIGAYAPVSLTAMGRKGPHEWLLGEGPSDQLMRYVELDQHVTDRNPPTFLWTTADDRSVPADQALLMGRALLAKGVPCSVHLFASGRHGLGLARDNPHVHQWTALCGDWLEDVGFDHGSV